ncbi:bifunctional isocitrate dehydrogenase kinase/phosphatase [Pusillimonas sp. ANT_WB101]|uniref:bifunctional isocitrate dehydrogenase kinase/phosphatase n=1 Tax=Pusillimonas sp. ANT_WB101 TaxID=2597356 RepID=UPI0011ED5202|nr:bifunctional isocitrate dehydrogenase kinase/phosphatase [Pusillimonas sp. ANT_WB101]KAA0891159.1 bifunctional isocitrate dehydrogenase kinase/phosphatase [Pusillimonas sp. ANT_WB101]
MTYIGDHQRIEPATRPGLTPAAVAQVILDGFNRHYSLFRFGAQRAKALFESGNWHGIQQLSRERIEYYDTRVRECTTTLNSALKGSGTRPAGGQDGATHADASDHPGESSDVAAGLTAEQAAFWQDVKGEFVALLPDHRQPECAETFFNSVSCRILHRDYFHNNFMFVRPAIATEYLESRLPSYRVYYPTREGLVKSLLKMMADFGLAAPFADLPADMRALVRRAVHKLRRDLPGDGGPRIAPDCQIHVLNSLFFRNKGAYVVGRLVNQTSIHPFAIALVRTPSGHVRADALLHEADDLSTLFSFTRAYFLVDMETPAAYVNFLNTLLPRKPKAELYTILGLQKQGKTLFYRDFLQHLAHSHDNFDVAPGIHGLVMVVFTLPSYPYVFKLIRDRIKKDGMDHPTVRRKYQLVKKHDRVGRMADTWEYSQVALPRSRFSPALLQELRKEVPSLLEESDDTIVLRHVYIERRMTPLNIFLMRANDAALDVAVKGYGDAIRELAAANIFPGDMLFKNFGVTRLGRIVFYDYDEIQRMTEMNFRRIPPAPNFEAEMSGEPWYPVGRNDVFPEEFSVFLLGNPRVRAAFMKYHADLLEAEWWNMRRQRAAHGRIEDIFPYPDSRRLCAAAVGRKTETDSTHP